LPDSCFKKLSHSRFIVAVKKPLPISRSMRHHFAIREAYVFPKEINMNTATKICLMAGCLFASFAQAASFEDYARVTNVTPQVEEVNQPRQECQTEYVPLEQQHERGVGGSIVGGVAGGVIGNQVGGGRGRVVATAAGAIAGAIIGDRVQNSDAGTTVRQEPVRQCKTYDHWESRTTGYKVTYEYRGHNYTEIMPYDPGDRVRLQVSLTPR